MSFNNALNEVLSNLSDKINNEEKERLSQKFKSSDIVLGKDDRLLDYSRFYFENRYNKNDDFKIFAIDEINKIHKPVNKKFGTVFYYGEDLEKYLSDFFKEVNGFSCCTDKAREVVSMILRSLRIGKPIKFTGDNYYSPILKNFKLWEELILTHPLIDKRKSLNHARVILKIHSKIKMIKSLKTDFSFLFTNFLKDNIERTEYLESFQINPNEELMDDLSHLKRNLYLRRNGGTVSIEKYKNEASNFKCSLKDIILNELSKEEMVYLTHVLKEKYPKLIKEFKSIRKLSLS